MLVIIIVVVFALLLIGVYFLGKSGTFNSKASPQQSKTYNENKYSMGQNAYLPVSTWSKFVPNDKANPYSGSCLNYTVKSSTLALGFPSIDDLNNSTGQYVKSTQECVDPDQILAQAGTHTCQNPSNGGGGTGCITSTSFNGYATGDFVPVGVTEGITPANPYYITCGSKLCPGEIGLIVPNFTNVVSPNVTLGTKPSTIDPNSNYPNCIQNNSITEPNTGAFYTGLLPCDLSDPSQVFRTVRYSFDDSYTPSVDPAGIYAAIIHRATGFYLAPDMNYLQSINPVTGDFIPNSYTYYFDSLVVNTDPNDNTNRYVNLILINPAYDTVRNGIYWLLQNQTPDATKPADAIDPANSINCDTSKVYPINVGTDVPSNCLTTGVPPWYNPCNPSTNTTCGTFNNETYIPYSPQQFVYVPNIYLVPKDTTDLVEYWTYLTNQYSIQVGSTSILDPNNWRAVDDAYKGLWDSSITYLYGDIVYYQHTTTKQFYMSIDNGDNLNNNPFSTLGTEWIEVVFDGATPVQATVLPLTQNYKGNWNAGTNYKGPYVTSTPPITFVTGDVVTTTVSSNSTYIATADSFGKPVSNTSYWQQITTYNTTPLTYVRGQLFSTSEGNCYIYIGATPGSTVALPNLFVTINNVPMLKKFLTKIPADVWFYDNQYHSGQSRTNPFWGVDTSVFNIPAPFGVSQYMESIITQFPSGGKFYPNGSNTVIASITPKLTTNPTGVTSAFTDTTKLLDSQFAGATNLTLQLQSPVSVFKDPISYQYSAYNPFNVVQ